MDQFAIFGNPVSHSKSPLMHNLAFKSLGHKGCYGRYLLEDGTKLKETFFTLGLKGANITVPHKEEAFHACDVLDSFAQKVGAVNTIVKKEGKLYGYNTDAPGFLKAISEIENIRTILILGAGGTAQSTSVILKESGYSVSILNRSQKRLTYFSERGYETYTFENFKSTAYDMIINMTSAGLEDDSLPAPKEILEKIIPQAKACVDIIYGKETPFLKLSKERNIPTKDGSDMLLHQGVIALDYFTNGRYAQNDIEHYMKKAFSL